MGKPTFQYHPVRYAKHMRPAFEMTADQFYGHSDGDREELGGLLASTVFGEVARRLIEADPHPTVPADPDQWGQHQEMVFGAYQSYLTNGENIFHIQPALADMFTKTDVDQIAVDQLRLPFDAFYLHFGQVDGLQLPSRGRYIDGAYVQDGEVLMICFTAADPGLDYAEPLPVARFMAADEQLEFVLGGEPGMTVGQSIQDAQRDFTRVDHLREVYTQWEPAFPAATRLLMNALCYLGSPHREVNERFSDDTPKTIARKYASATSRKQRDRVLSKAKAQGFRRIQFLGDSIQGAAAVRGAGEVSPHWRRGHWRNQAHGPERRQHRLVWIQPTIVKGDQGAPVKGKHLYEVDSKPGE